MSAWSAKSIFRQSLRLVIGLMFVVCLGCGEDVAIRQYTVDKSEANRSTASVTSEKREQQLLGAIVPNKETTWFFKLTGTPAEVAAAENQFREIINSSKFGESGEPLWQLPSGWNEQRLEGITFAKFVQKEIGLSATVTQLPSPPGAGDDAWRDWVRGNVNRWRGQLSLAEQDWDAMKAELQELKALNQGESRAYYVSLVGKGSGQMAGGPFSGGAAGPFSGGPFSGPKPAGQSPAMPSSANSGAPPELKYTVPAGWEKTAASGMRLAAFKVTQNELQAEVTVISAGGDKRSNVARWQRQLIPDASEELIDKVIASAEPVDVNGLPCELYKILGKDGPEQGSFLAAIVPWQPGASLFIKFTGPAKLAEPQQKSFAEFVTSLKW